MMSFYYHIIICRIKNRHKPLYLFFSKHVFCFISWDVFLCHSAKVTLFYGKCTFGLSFFMGGISTKLQKNHPNRRTIGEEMFAKFANNGNCDYLCTKLIKKNEH